MRAKPVSITAEQVSIGLRLTRTMRRIYFDALVMVGCGAGLDASEVARLPMSARFALEDAGAIEKPGR